MKRFLVIILALLHLASVSGATVRMHYCMGRFVDANIASHTGDEDGHECGRCGMKKAPGNDCCKDEHKFIKDASDKAYKHSLQFSFSPVAFILPAVTPIYTGPVIYKDGAAQSLPVANAPPDWPELPIYLQVRSLRI